MLKFEELLTRLQAENLDLTTADQVVDEEARHALTGAVNRKAIDRFAELRQYLAPYPITVTNDLEIARDTVAQLASKDRLGLDIETAPLPQYRDHPQGGLNPKVSEIQSVQIFDGEKLDIFTDLLPAEGADTTWLDPIRDNHITAHNGKFEAAHFNQLGVRFSNLHCTMLQGRVFLNRNHSLAEMSKSALDLEIDKSLQVSDWTRRPLLKEQELYAAADAVIAYQLEDFLAELFQQHPHYWDTYQHLRSQIYPIVDQMALGIAVDWDEHARVYGEWAERLRQVTEALYLDGLKDPAKVKAKQIYLKQKLSPDELAAWPKTKSGNLSTTSDAIGMLSNHPTLTLLAEFTTLSTRLSNFGPNLRSFAIDGKVYPDYSIASMVTGRYGCSKPNLQNQPRSGFKQIYIAPEGHRFVTGDLAQVELRVAALLSGDRVMLDLYDKGIDLHLNTASQIAGVPVSEVTKEIRQKAKGVNFGLLFGQGALGLQRYAKATYGVDMSLVEASEAKEVFAKTYPDLALWQREIVKHTNRYDESETEHFRLTRHYGPGDRYIDGEYRDVYSHAMNFPIQGTAAEILQLAILYIHRENRPGIHISHHVYDELCLLAEEDKVIEAAYLLRDAFRYGYQTVFPGCSVNDIIEVGAGKNWAEAGSDDAIIHLDEISRNCAA